jgi:hypothetical protein
MKERPILFSAPMVRAILDGRKTQTRRVFRQAAGPSLDIDVDEQLGVAVLSWLHGPGPGHEVQERTARHTCPHGKPGDLLWVRETWGVGTRPCPARGWRDGIEYRADCAGGEPPPLHEFPERELESIRRGWRPSIFMPRWASRITLEITKVRVQRLQEINGEDAAAEGILVPRCGCEVCRMSSVMCPADASAHIEEYGHLWDSINGSPRPMLDDDGKPVLDDNDRPIMIASRSWESNPWVWALTFRRVER